MGQFFTGRTGSLVFDGKPVAKIRDWSLETTVELLSTNSIDSAVNTFTPGAKGATGSATLMYYRLSSSEANTNTEFSKLLNKLLRKDEIDADDEKVELTLNVGHLADDDIRLKAYLTSATVSVSTGELSVVNVSFTMTGDFLEVINV
jgi:hypothetical protein